MYINRTFTKEFKRLEEEAFALIRKSINENPRWFKSSDGLDIKFIQIGDSMESESVKAPGMYFQIQCSEPRKGYVNGRYKYNAASWTMVQLPGCCGVVVSTGARVAPEFRKLGLGTILNRMRIELAKMSGYSLMLCTDVTHNEPQQKILNKNGWSKIFDFRNSRTGNEIGLHVLSIY